MNAPRTPALRGVVVACLCILFLASTTDVYAKVFPNVDYIEWNYDVNLNRLDDRLEEMAPYDTVDAVVLFNRCLTTDDVAFVDTVGTIAYIGKYVQGIWLDNAIVGSLLGLPYTAYGDTTVFRVEKSEVGEFTLDYSCPAVRAKQSGDYSPQTAWDQNATGSGVVIAILDSGVDDGHPAFAGKYVTGYNAETDNAENPNDALTALWHGTHVAGIALGNDPNGTYQGVARDALLVDVKVGTWAPTSVGHQRAIDWCTEHREDHNIRVLNLSYKLGNSCNGKCADCMAVDSAVDKGLVVCVAAGNDAQANWIPSPAAADRAITVGAVDDDNSVDRTDDTHAAFSNSGPRVSDNDNDTIDEEKPDVVAPGVDIWSAQGRDPDQNPPNQYHSLGGTSMASPHVAGVAAILLSDKPTLTPDDVKVILRESSTDQAQNPNPAWSAQWGKGEVDAYRAICVGAQDADLYINSWVRDIYTPQDPPQAGQQTTLHARVRNHGPNAANNVTVMFFTNRNNVGYGGWTQIGQDVVNVPSGGMTVATVNWTPLEGHQCVRAKAVYCRDYNHGNDQGQDNFDPQQSEFFVEAGTPFTGLQNFRLSVDSSDLLVEDGWWAKIWSEDNLFDTLFVTERDTTDVDFDIEDDYCPRIIRVDINHPPDADPDSSSIVLEGWVDTLMVGRQTLLSYISQSAVEEEQTPSNPISFHLAQNHPNPFNPITVIEYALARDCRVTLDVYNVRGQRVAVIVDGREKAGYKSATWDARDVASGIYFYRLRAGDFVETKKMILLK